MKIGIVVGSIREGRKGATVAQWVHDVAKDRTEAEFEIVDLKSFDVPLFSESYVPGGAARKYEDPHLIAWGEAIDSYDAFIFVVPEYNHSIPGAFKNALDALGPEWTGKSVAFVSYGAEGGIRATEHLRQIVANFQMVGVRGAVTFSIFTEFDGEDFTPDKRRKTDANTMLDQLLAATKRQLA